MVKIFCRWQLIILDRAKGMQGMVTVYLKRGEEMFGPFTPDDIKAGVQNRQVINGDLISQSAEGPWTSVEDIKGLGLDEEPVMQPQLPPIETQSVLEQPVQQHAPIQQQVQYPQQQHEAGSSIAGMGVICYGISGVLFCIAVIDFLGSIFGYDITGVFWSPIAFSLVAGAFGALGKKLEEKADIEGIANPPTIPSISAQQPPPQQQHPQHVPVPQLAIPGLSKGTCSPNVFRILFNIWPLLFIYGMPLNCKIPNAAGSSARDAIDAIAELFLSRGYEKRTFGAKLVSGITLKCPGAIVAYRDIRIKETGNSITVIGYRKDINQVLFNAGLLDL